MLIDWFTVVAQIVNFLILVWLLQHFLYTPILDAIDAREKRIAAALAEAAANEEDARKERDLFLRRNEELSLRQASLLRTATLEVKLEREKLFEAARNEAEEFRIRQQKAMIDDCNTLKEEILRRTREEVFAIARKTLTDLAGESLEKSMVETFIRRCRDMDITEKSALRSVLKSPAGQVCIRSAFPLADQQRQAIEHTVSEHFHYTGHCCFETSPDLVSGIAVSMDGYEVAWNISDYLLALEKGVTDSLHGHWHPEEQNQTEQATASGGDRSKARTHDGVDRHGS